MTRENAKRILQEENLKNYSWFDEKNIRPAELIIYTENNKWVVCAASERASIVESSYRYYDNEEEALDFFIGMLREEKRLYPEKYT